MVPHTITHSLLGAAAAAGLLATGAIFGSHFGSGHKVVVHAQHVAPVTAAAPAKASDTTPTATGNTLLPGIDVSHYQGLVDWASVASDGVRFAYAKATEGDSYVDKQFGNNLRGTTTNGIRVGAYHVFSMDDDPTAQVKHFLSVASIRSGMLPPAIDIEKASSSDDDLFRKRVQAWLMAFSRETGCIPMIYVSTSTWENHVEHAVADIPHLLWISHPTDGKRPPDIKDWQLWQHSFSGKVKGVSGNVDLDSLRGSEPVMERMLLKIDPATGKCRQVG